MYKGVLLGGRRLCRYTSYQITRARTAAAKGSHLVARTKNSRLRESAHRIIPFATVRSRRQALRPALAVVLHETQKHPQRLHGRVRSAGTLPHKNHLDCRHDGRHALAHLHAPQQH